MSPICQNFVQNSWRRDICSNCFKSKEEHCEDQHVIDPNSSPLCNNVHKVPESLDSYNTKRYVGVAAGTGVRSTMYSRNYYNPAAWSAIMENKNMCPVLKSPSLIKGLDSMIKQENEKNRRMSEEREVYIDDKSEEPNGHDDIYDISGSKRGKGEDGTVVQKESWILAALIEDAASRKLASLRSNLSDDGNKAELGPDIGLGMSESEISDSCSSSSSSIHDNGKLTESITKENLEDLAKSDTCPKGILKSTSEPKSMKRIISFLSDDEVIGFGGDVDYTTGSEDECDFDDDDDDDSISSGDLSFDERELKHVTEKNTDFNSEYTHLRLKKEFREEEEDDKSEPEQQPEPVPEVEPEPQKPSEAENKKEKCDSQKGESGKVKLKRSQPITPVKSEMRSNFNVNTRNSVKANNTSGIYDSPPRINDEDVPMRGIKPKFVPIHEEMRGCDTDFSQANSNSSQRITSVDNIPKKVNNVESIDIVKQVNVVDSCTKKSNSVNISCVVQNAPVSGIIPNPQFTSTPLALSTKEENPHGVKVTSIDEAIKNIDDFDDTLNYDYSVKSAQHIQPLLITPYRRQLESITSSIEARTLKEIENSKENLERVRSAVIPVNMVNVRRRSSFMESQLGGSFSSNDDVTRPADVSSCDVRLVEQIKETDLHVKKLPSVNHAIQKRVSPCLDECEESIFSHKPIPVVDYSSINASESLSENLKMKNLENSRALLFKELQRNVKTALDRGMVSKPSGLDNAFPSNATKAVSSDTPSRQVIHASTKASAKIIPADKAIHSNVETDAQVSQNDKCQTATSKLDLRVKPINRTENIEKAVFKVAPIPNKVTNSNFKILNSNDSKVPKSSFLHSSPVRSAESLEKIKSVIYASPQTLKGIPSSAHSRSPLSPTRSTGSKPATTPKPSYLKKSTKESESVSVIQTSQSSHSSNVEILKVTGQSVSSSKPQVTTDDSVECEEVERVNSKPNTVDPCIYSIPVAGNSNQMHLTPRDSSDGEGITTCSSGAPSPTSSSSGYSTTSNHSEKDLSGYLGNGQMTPVKLKDDLNPSDSYETSKHSSIPEEISKTSRILFAEACKSKPEESTEGIPTCSVESYSHSGPIYNNIPTCTILVPPCPTKVPQVLVSPSEDVPTEDPSEPIQLAYRRLNSASYENLAPSINDVDSFSSFTDDFDEEDDEPENKRKGFYEINADLPVDPVTNCDDVPSFRRTERSSSATAIFRNSVGPVNYAQDGSYSTGSVSSVPQEIFPKAPAVRSQSVPRSVEHSVKPNLGKPKTDSSSRFSFVKAGLFRPCSPSSSKRKSSSERESRDRSKKGHFSLKKFLRFGSSSSSSAVNEKIEKSKEEVEKESEREERKKKLQIIHPLDYHTSGVEVIARPEKTTPIYGLPGGYPSATQLSAGELQQQQYKVTKAKKVEKKNSFLKKRSKPERHVSSASINKFRNPFSSSSHGNSSKDSKRDHKLVSSPHPSVNTHIHHPSLKRENNSTNNLNVLNSVNANPNANTHPNAAVRSLSYPSEVSETVLGFNSEGRPKPLPPPRKTSLVEETLSQEAETLIEEVQPNENLHSTESRPNSQASRFSSNDDRTSTSSFSSNTNSNSTSGGAEVVKPNRPPPPRRTPSSAGAVAAPKQDSLYANLGNVRVAFTPRKPDRCSSLREDEVEKRKAPKPPRLPIPSASSNKGPAPRVPSLALNKQNVSLEFVNPFLNHEYEYIGDSPLKPNEGQNILPLLEHPDATDRLAMMLDKMSSESEPLARSFLLKSPLSWNNIRLSSDSPRTCGRRVFYSGQVFHDTSVNDPNTLNVTIMVTTELNIKPDDYLMPKPLLTFIEDIPSNFIKIGEDSNSTTTASVSILQSLHLTQLSKLSHSLMKVLQQRPTEWQLQVCTFLLQLVVGLKQLQAGGVEESSLDLIAVAETQLQGHKTIPRLILVPPVGFLPNNVISLCHCAAAVTVLLLGHCKPIDAAIEGPILSPPFTPSPHAFSALVETLREERASSLTKAKCILEAMLFGPPPSSLLVKDLNVDEFLKFWIENERINVLKRLEGQTMSESESDPKSTSLASQFTKPNLTSFLTKFNLIFLVHTNAKALRDALKLIEAPDVTFF